MDIYTFSTFHHSPSPFLFNPLALLSHHHTVGKEIIELCRLITIALAFTIPASIATVVGTYTTSILDCFVIQRNQLFSVSHFHTSPSLP